MGVAITQLVPSKTISIDELKGKVLAIDGHNMLYQFLTTIRGPDGAPLTDSNGNITSHLTGLFSRTSNLLSRGIKLVFVFDGKIPELKRQELDRRKAQKEAAAEKYEEAKQKKDTDEMKKYAGRTSRLTPELLDQAKQLLDALGVPWLDAPSEGEAQAAALVKQGHAWAVVSQDTDSLLYEAPRVIKNLAITGKRKLPGKLAYVSVEPELIEHKQVLKELQLDSNQLRILAVLVGTDYNIGGVKGIGPKKGLKLVQKNDFESAFDKEDVPWKNILRIFEDMPVKDPGVISFGAVSEKDVKNLLIEKHDFSKERVESSLKKIKSNTQKGLDEFFAKNK